MSAKKQHCSTIAFLMSRLLCICLLQGVGIVRAQHPVFAGGTPPVPAAAATDKLAPTMSAVPGAKEHVALLASLYPDALLKPLADNYDRSIPGGFPVALARARAAGLPESLLAELEATHAMFEADFSALAATLPRLQAARATWQERTSMFSNFKDFDYLLTLVSESVGRESVAPGSFAQTADRVRKRDIARAVYNDLRVVEGSSDQYSLLHNCHRGDLIPLEGWLAYAPTKAHVWVNRGADVLGHPFGQQRVGDQPVVPAETYQAVADAVPDSFWAPYPIPGTVAKR